MHQLRRSSTLTVAIFAGVVLAGCKKAALSPDDLIDKTDALYEKYISSDAPEAKESLLEALQCIEKADLEPQQGAQLKFMTYVRLYVLCESTGETEEAETYLVHARYWFVRKNELRGLTPHDVGRSIAAFTPDRFVSFVQKWDAHATNGKGPRYLMDLRNEGMEKRSEANSPPVSANPAAP